MWNCRPTTAFVDIYVIAWTLSSFIFYYNLHTIKKILLTVICRYDIDSEGVGILSILSSNGIQENLEVGILGAAVDQYSILAAVTKVLESSSCENLKTFSQEMLIFWRRLLLEKLARYDKVTNKRWV